MKNIKVTTIFSLLSAVIIATPALAQNRQTPMLPDTKPDKTVSVERQSGTCPNQVGFWTSSHSYEGGAENTVIADTLAIAGAAQLVLSSKTAVEYKAPLKKAYSSCVAKASSDTYKFRFQDGSVYFRVDLNAIAQNPSTPAEIIYKTLVSSRPYVRWAIAD